MDVLAAAMQFTCIFLALLTCTGIAAQEYQTEVWPSPDTIRANLSGVRGPYYLPGDPGYAEAAWVNNQPMFSTEPGLVFYPMGVDDVKLALAFAREHRIRPAILSSGHSYIGRSTGLGTLQLNMMKMTEVSTNLADPESDTGASMTTQTGNNWGILYNEANVTNHVVVGGSAVMVSPGGYFLGGGHSPLSRTYGLGIDSLLRIWIVLADGSYVNVTDPNIGSTWIQHPDGSTGTMAQDKAADLWWALRGGGLSVGVIIAYKFKMHPGVQQINRIWFSCSLGVTTPHGNVGAPTLQALSNFILNDMPTNMGGYILANGHHVEVNAYGIGTVRGTLTLSFVHHGSREQAFQQIEPLNKTLNTLCSPKGVDTYSTFADYEKKNGNDPIAQGVILVDRFITPGDLADSSKFNAIIGGLGELPEAKDIPYGCTCTIIGGKVTENKGKIDAAVNPDFRDGILSCTCATGWAFGDERYKDYITKGFYKWADEKFYTLGKGVYFNEPDYQLDNWKVEFWGSMERYNRLLQIKQHFDPDHMFYCPQCVGSDLVAGRSNDPYNDPFKPNGAGTIHITGSILITLAVMVINTMSCRWTR